MESEDGSQATNPETPHNPPPPKGSELVIPNPKLKLMDQVREVLRVKHYATMIYTHVLRQSGSGMKARSIACNLLTPSRNLTSLYRIA